MIKIRTIYFKVSNMEQAVSFWSSFLGFEPHKGSDYWTEFKCSNINLGLLFMNKFNLEEDKSNCVPVFELSELDFKKYVEKAKSLQAKVIMDIEDHPDKKSYVFADPFNNEFELTTFSD